MKVLVAIFSCFQNKPYLEVCLQHLNASIKKLGCSAKKIEILLIDFSPEGSDLYKFEGINHYARKPNARFGANFNSAREFAFFCDYDWLVSVNDDAMIGENFLVNGLDFLAKYKEVGMVAGVANAGPWCLPLSEVKIPPETLLSLPVQPLDRLYWEASACILRVKMLEDVGKWDVRFDENGSSVCSDNDYYLRCQKKGWKLFRSGKLPFFHCKGISQSKFRIPTLGAPDPLKEQNLDYFEKKWGVRLESGRPAKPFDTPFNLPLKEE